MFKIYTVRALTVAVLVLALVMSFLHIAEAFALLGAGWDRWTAPLLIDVVAVIGKIATGAEFTAPARRLGRRALYVAGCVSLVSNVAVGYAHQQYGSALLGAIVVSVALWGETMITKLRPTAAARKAAKPAPAAPAVTASAAQQAKRSAAAQKAAATRKANAARKAPQAAAPAQATAQHYGFTFPADTRAYL